MASKDWSRPATPMMSRAVRLAQSPTSTTLAAWPAVVGAAAMCFSMVRTISHALTQKTGYRSLMWRKAKAGIRLLRWRYIAI